MKKFLFILLCINHSLFPQYTLEENSEHFKLFCSEKDLIISEEILHISECFYSKIEKEFNYILKNKFKIYLYETLKDFHDAIGMKDAPDWVVSKAEDEKIYIVSPINPGSFHTKESIEQILLLNIVKSLIYQKFGKDCAPFWLIFGISSLKSGYNSLNVAPKIVPTFEQLENSIGIEFNKINGFQCSYFFVEFLEKNYGWEKILELLHDYDNFENIFQIQKNILYREWLNSLNLE